jgi:hypothetical protein
MIELFTIALALLGVYILVSGTLPRFIASRERAVIRAAEARLLGVTLLLPLPLAIVLTVVIIVTLGPDAAGAAARWLDILTLLGMLALFFALLLFFQRPRAEAAASDRALAADALAARDAIEKLGRQALLFALTGSLGAAAPVLCPLAYRRAEKALRLIKAQRSAERWRVPLRAVRIAAALTLGFYIVVVVWAAAVWMTMPRP